MSPPMQSNGSGGGVITVQHTIWCAVCEQWDQRSGRKSLCLSEWKEEGWKKVRNQGWTCVGCLWPKDFVS